jgi:predicted dehydrogenase
VYGEACHFFDLLSWFIDAEPVKIYNEGGLEDYHITVRFSDGSRGVLTSSAQGGMGYPKELFECFADYQSVIVEGNMCLTHSGKCGQVTVTNYPLFFDPYPGLPGDLPGYRQRMANYSKDMFEGKFKEFSHPSGYKGHYEELDECINAVLENRPFSANEIDGARAVFCCEAAVQSAKSGLPVTLDPSRYGAK